MAANEKPPGIKLRKHTVSSEDADSENVTEEVSNQTSQCEIKDMEDLLDLVGFGWWNFFFFIVTGLGE